MFEKVAFTMYPVEDMAQAPKGRGVTFKAEDIESPVCRMAVSLDSLGNAIILHKLKTAEERAAG